MTLFVDTSVWSLAFRRDQVATAPEARALRDALEGGETIVVTGLVLQELLQGFAGPKPRKDIVDRFSALPLLAPDRLDHIDAAELRNRCTQDGSQTLGETGVSMVIMVMRGLYRRRRLPR